MGRETIQIKNIIFKYANKKNKNSFKGYTKLAGPSSLANLVNASYFKEFKFFTE